MSPFKGHLGGEVFLCAAEGGVYPLGGSGLDELRAAKVGNNEMAGDIDEDVLWFQVSMNDPGLMESVDRKNQFTGVKLNGIRVQCAVSHQISEKVSSGTEILSRL